MTRNVDDFAQFGVEMRKHQGNVSQTARELGLTRTALYRRMEKYGL